MRDVVSCFSENAIDVSCSSYLNKACMSPNLIPSVQNAVASLYKIILSTRKQVTVLVTWCRNQTSQGLSINFGSDPSSSFKINTNDKLFRRKRGNKVFELEKFKIEVFWDLSSAKYVRGPEPVGNFYVLVMVDSEISLVMGDLGEETITKKFKTNTPFAKVSLLSRQEHCAGNTLYATKAKFCDSGIQHDILIKCSGENEGLKHPVLSVYIDKKMVIRVKRLQWNFRGNQSIFLDGLLVDMMWDVHDWFFNPASGYAVFMFRTRSGMHSRLWLEENMVHKEQQKVEFSLLIHAYRNL
ncbi:hypothetical protein K2173_020703 [Erythroxylum novogranatense]|uniref:DUF868 domain-containing protein n=1 Tax=Erythroxylum novogranatense TaxID=1862640 RepID=A0AAV8TPK0_9ROSI|nr:hypothetical protein K2173_020703 [Erythroxylum novogranatense]